MYVNEIACKHNGQTVYLYFLQQLATIRAYRRNPMLEFIGGGNLINISPPSYWRCSSVNSRALSFVFGEGDEVEDLRNKEEQV